MSSRFWLARLAPVALVSVCCSDAVQSSKMTSRSTLLPGAEGVVSRVREMLEVLYPEVADVDKVGRITVSLESRGEWVVTPDYAVEVRNLVTPDVVINFAGTSESSYFIEAVGKLFDEAAVPSLEERDRRIQSAITWLCSSNGWSLVEAPHKSLLKDGFVEARLSMNGRGPAGNESSETRAFFDGRRGYLRLVGTAARLSLPSEIDKALEHHRQEAASKP